MLVEKKSEEYPSELNRLIRRIDQLMPHPGNINETAQALTMVLWAIRDQLSFKSAIQFLDRLPLSLKAVYLDHWNIHERIPKRLTAKGDLVKRIELNIPDLLQQIHPDQDITRERLYAVLKMIASMTRTPVREKTSTLRLGDMRRSKAESVFDEDNLDTPDSSIWLP